MTGPLTARPRPILVLASYIGFISLGLPDTLIGVAWPSVRETFGLRQGDIAWIFFGVGCSYFVSSFFAGALLRRFGVGAVLAGSSALVALSGFDYAAASIWALFAAGALLHGLGSGAIDSGLNHYVATHFSPQHMNWLHACYSLGAMLGPWMMTYMIVTLESWRTGYLLVAVILLVLSTLFFATRKLWNDHAASSPRSNKPAATSQTAAPASAVLRNSLTWHHIIIFFVYTGLEVAFGQWCFTVLTESRNIPEQTAGGWVTLYWGSILAGRIGFGFIANRANIDQVIRLSTIAALAGAALFAWNPAPAVLPMAVILAGLGLAVIFPCLMTRTSQRFGVEAAAHVIGFQVGAAMLGAAALPSLAGLLAQRIGLQFVPSVIFAMAAGLIVLHEALLIRNPKASL